MSTKTKTREENRLFFLNQLTFVKRHIYFFNLYRVMYIFFNGGVK